MYLELKALHVSLAIISTALFLLRLGLSWWGKRPSGWQRGLPHLIDTLLLLSAWAWCTWRCPGRCRSGCR